MNGGDTKINGILDSFISITEEYKIGEHQRYKVIYM